MSAMRPMRKKKYIVSWHICSMCLAQCKNNVMEASFTILNRSNCGKLFHSWQAVNTSIASFSQFYSYGKVNDEVGRAASSRVIAIRSILTVGIRVLMAAQYLILMTVNSCKRDYNGTFKAERLLISQSRTSFPF